MTPTQESRALTLARSLDATIGASTDDTDQAVYAEIGEIAGGLGDCLVADLAWLFDTAAGRATSHLPYIDSEHYGWAEAERERRKFEARETAARDWRERAERVLDAAREKTLVEAQEERVAA